MGEDTGILLTKIISLFLVIVVGWIARRRDYFTAQTTSAISRFTTDIALPVFIFMQMLETVNRQALRESWIVPIFAAAVINIGFFVGWAGWRIFAHRRQAPTFIFVIGISNWIYLPLPIVQALYPDDGLRQLLLANAAIWVVLWTVGVAVLHGGRIDRQSLLNLLKSPGLMATLAGIALTMLKPAGTVGLPLQQHAAMRTVFEAMTLLGSITIPLSLVVTGAQLGAIHIAGQRPGRAVAGVVLLRLMVVPLLAMLLAMVVQQGPWPMPHTGMMVVLIIAAMPVAVGCTIYTERFGQDPTLAAQSILYTTLLSMVTVPLLYGLAKLL